MVVVDILVVVVGGAAKIAAAWLILSSEAVAVLLRGTTTESPRFELRERKDERRHRDVVARTREVAAITASSYHAKGESSYYYSDRGHHCDLQEERSSSLSLSRRELLLEAYLQNRDHE
ncbi:uncharacterized protein LOC112468455 [Temnothorax curvispinosus]|uniref:Uncharacterized protein LOC112458418 n=1 Tax=Temnothorax curvispinosus TaxID=300111 RepID=A0A6J1QAG1_9HYME|nr:uncharacterized protein LOC112458418 [Temnothorax curvispinosus]XP_024893414.1 uncharacterized protein LOC112468455 [Temnothorax curvispinosus]